MSHPHIPSHAEGDAAFQRGYERGRRWAADHPAGGLSDALAALRDSLDQTRRLAEGLQRPAPAAHASPAAPTLDRVGYPVRSTPTGPAAGRGVLQLTLGDSTEFVVQTRPVDVFGQRCVYRLLRVVCAEHARALVDALCWLLLNRYDPPRTFPEAGARSTPMSWKSDGVWNGAIETSGLTAVVQVVHEGAEVVRCFCAPDLVPDLRAFLAAMRERLYPDALTAEQEQQAAEAATIARREREDALGCRILRERGGLAVLGDYLDGRRAFHARRRAVKEAQTSQRRPALAVVRSTVRA